MAGAIVDAKYRFIWWSNGFAAWRLLWFYAIILSSWDEIQQGTVIPNISAEVDGVRVAPFVVGDSAFHWKKG